MAIFEVISKFSILNLLSKLNENIFFELKLLFNISMFSKSILNNFNNSSFKTEFLFSISPLIE